jgi:nitrate reductase NapAB chaperone NapD
MHYSGIIVTARPQELADTSHRVDAVPGVEVHHLDPEGGRIVAVLETETLEEQQEGLRRLQELPGVLAAALVEHRSEELEPTGTDSEQENKVDE